jgi:hypothetical protein
LSKLLNFKWVASDSQLIQPSEKQKLSFFIENTGNAINDAVQKESMIVKWLVSQECFKSMLLNELDLPDCTKFYKNLTKPFITTPYNNPGDLDILLINPDQPQNSIAIECKKVNVFKYSGQDKINKINKVKKSVKQTKGLLEMGFYNVYLAVIIGTFGSKHTEANLLYRGIGEQKFQELYDFPDRENLDSRVGIMFVEVVQPTGNSLNQTGIISLCIDRFAEKQEQSKSITENVKSMLLFPSNI